MAHLAHGGDFFRFERLVADKVAEDAAYRVFSMPKVGAWDGIPRSIAFS